MGGLAAAIGLAGNGYDVLVLEKEDAPGGKARHVTVGDVAIDGGPTVFTMKWVFDRLLEGSDQRLEDVVDISMADILARHFWTDGTTLDLHADIDASAEAIAAFSDETNAAGYRRFCADGERIFETLKEPFMADQRPNLAEFMWRIGPLSIRRHLALRPFRMIWSALGGYFSDPRLRQLFARYSTYVGSSPFMTPATLMLVAHVEQDGVWMVDGGMHALAKGLVQLGEARGVRYRFGAGVKRIVTHEDRVVTGVLLDDGEPIEAAGIIFNGDVSALAKGLVGDAAMAAKCDPVEPARRSLSAMVWTGLMDVPEFPLAHHNVFFAPDYRDEFGAIFGRRVITDAPTVYICAQDRASDGTLNAKAQARGTERVLMLINAPGDGDMRDYEDEEAETCLTQTLDQLARCGLHLDRTMLDARLTTPTAFNRLFPGSGGALYGRASHGWLSSFRRPGARTALKGLYLAGGSVHPGPGVPMATLSGMLAADAFLSDRSLTPSFPAAATSGGTSME